MTKNRKFNTLAIAMVIFFNAFSVNAKAAETDIGSPLKDNLGVQNEIQLYEQKLENIDIFWENCESGAIPTQKAVEYANTDEGSRYKVTSYQFENQIFNSENREVTAETTIYEIEVCATASSTDFEYDPTKNVKGELTIYWDKSTYNGNSTRKLSKVSGKYVIEDSAASVLSQKVIYGQVGPGPGQLAGVNEVVNSDNAKKPTSSSWSYNTGFKGYTLSGSESIFGAKNFITIKRSSSNAVTFTVKVGTI